jgi:Ca-activated chloride channel homolog
MQAVRLLPFLLLSLVPSALLAADPPAAPAAAAPAGQPGAPAEAGKTGKPPQGEKTDKGEKAKTEKSGKMSRREQNAAIKALPQKYRDWLAEVDVLITNDEKTTFLRLEKDYQRDAFIKRFWEVRDPIPNTPRNEFLDRWNDRVEEAKARFGGLTDERSRILLLNGEPAAIFVSTCGTILWPLEAWFYAGSDRLGEEFLVVFYKKWGAGLFRIWNPLEGVDTLFIETAGNGFGNANGNSHNLAEIANGCRDGDKLAGAIGWVASRSMDYALLQSRIESRPDGPRGEWVSSFGSYSTDVAPDAVPLKASLDVDFPGRHQNRTAVQGLVNVAVGEATQAKLGEHVSYDFLINGEILQNGQLFDSFRYKFDFPGTEAAGTKLPIVFQRYLRPGEYTMVVKLEDINSGKAFRDERKLSVPAVDKALPAPPPTEMEAAARRLLEEANAAISNGETTVKLIPPHGELQSGMLRFDTLTTGADIASVTFALDGKPILTKKKPPYSVELDLGRLPRTRKLSVAAFDKGGVQLAGDDLLVNAAGHRFKVRLTEPRRGQKYAASLLAQADVDVPDGDSIEHVDFYLNEAKVATLYQPPYQQPIVLRKDQPLSYVRAVAYLPDGNSTEDLVFVNAPDYLENLDVQFVELYASVLDRAGHPVTNLKQKDFSVLEDGKPQTVARFERVSDLPIHAAVALDISASMEPNLARAQQAALSFLQGTIQPKDRAAVVVFNDHPNLTVKFTNDVKSLAGGLAGLKAERGTALYDTIVFTLYYFNGIKGQRAMLLLSDGKDEGSRFSYEDALEYARRAGVIIYTIGLGKDVDKKKMEKFAEETGGRSFFVQNASDLEGIYATIEHDLRSQYLIAYQSGNTSGSTEFRTVELKVAQPGLEPKTMRGYYP